MASTPPVAPETRNAEDIAFLNKENDLPRSKVPSLETRIERLEAEMVRTKVVKPKSHRRGLNVVSTTAVDNLDLSTL